MSRTEQMKRDDRFAPRRFQPVPLYLRRLKSYWIFVGKSWKTIADWTVLLYILVPAVWIGGGMWLDMLRHPPAWMVSLPAVMPLIVLGFIASGDQLRTLAEAGDGLYLHRYRKWTRTFVLSGMAYSLLVHAVASLVVIGVMLPVWRSGGLFTNSDLAGLALFAPLWALAWTLARDAVSRKTSGWSKPILLLLMRLFAIAGFVFLAMAGAGYPLVFGVVAIALALVIALLGGLRLRARGMFLHELEIETKAYDAAIGWMLKFNTEQIRKPRLSRPLLFPRSGRLFRNRDAASRLAELWIKSMIRHFDDIRVVGMFAGIGASALMAVPLPLAIPLWIVMPGLLIQWLKGHAKQWFKQPYIALFHWDAGIAQRAGAKARFWILLPVMLLWGLLIGVRFGLAWGGAAWICTVVFPAAGWFYMRAVHFGLRGTGSRDG